MERHWLQVRLRDRTLVGWLRGFLGDRTYGRFIRVVIDDTEDIVAGALPDPALELRTLEVPIEWISVSVADGLTSDLTKVLENLRVPHYAEESVDVNRCLREYSWPCAMVDLNAYMEIFDLDQFVPA